MASFANHPMTKKWAINKKRHVLTRIFKYDRDVFNEERTEKFNN